MTVPRASAQALTPETTRPRRRIHRRSCYRCYAAFTCASANARVYCATCRRRYGFPEPEVRCA